MHAAIRALRARIRSSLSVELMEGPDSSMIGQCGNQIGSSFWGLLRREVDAGSQGQESSFSSGLWSCLLEPPDEWEKVPGAGLTAGGFSAAGPGSHGRHTAANKTRARAVLVDSEPRAVRCALQAGGGLLRSECALTGQSGRGNNWALGYNTPPSQRSGGGAGEWSWKGLGGVDGHASFGHGLQGAFPSSDEPRDLMGAAMDRIRRQVERCDWPAEFVTIHSLGGGTGAGLGSRLLEALREEYPPNLLVDVAVMPRWEGDSPLQSYNTLLGLQFSNCYADAVLLFQNSDLLAALERVRPLSAGTRADGAGGAGASAASSGDASISLYDVNHYVATALAGLLLPAAGWAGCPAGARGPFCSQITRIVTEACPHPSAKLLEVRSTPVPTSSLSIGGAARRSKGSVGGSLSSVVKPWAPWSQTWDTVDIPPSSRDPLVALNADERDTWLRAVKKLGPMVPRYDGFDGNRPITTVGGVAFLRGGGDGGNVVKTSKQGINGRHAAALAQGWAQEPQDSKRPITSALEALYALPSWMQAQKAGGVGTRPSTGSLIGGSGADASGGRLGCLQTRFSPTPCMPASTCRDTVTVAANRSNVVGALTMVAQQAQLKLQARAFVHWYERYGCSADALQDAVDSALCVVDSYRYWHGHEDGE
eukprot:jgi/Mesvir1/16222/Mv08476-RA.1